MGKRRPSTGYRLAPPSSRKEVACLPRPPRRRYKRLLDANVFEHGDGRDHLALVSATATGRRVAARQASHQVGRRVERRLLLSTTRVEQLRLAAPRRPPSRFEQSAFAHVAGLLTQERLTVWAAPPRAPSSHVNLHLILYVDTVSKSKSPATRRKGCGGGIQIPKC